MTKVADVLSEDYRTDTATGRFPGTTKNEGIFARAACAWERVA
jgi:hypothetical protein